MPRLDDQLRFSRSAKDLCVLAESHAEEVADLVDERPLLAHALEADADRLAAALDAERRQLIKDDAARISCYEGAAREWQNKWPSVRRKVEGLPLTEAHGSVVDEASGVLPDANPEQD